MNVCEKRHRKKRQGWRHGWTEWAALKKTYHPGYWTLSIWKRLIYFAHRHTRCPFEECPCRPGSPRLVISPPFDPARNPVPDPSPLHTRWSSLTRHATDTNTHVHLSVCVRVCVMLHVWATYRREGRWHQACCRLAGEWWWRRRWSPLTAKSENFFEGFLCCKEERKERRKGRNKEQQTERKPVLPNRIFTRLSLKASFRITIIGKKLTLSRLTWTHAHSCPTR